MEMQSKALTVKNMQGVLLLLQWKTANQIKTAVPKKHRLSVHAWQCFYHGHLSFVSHLVNHEGIRHKE
jgi:hypothetical protein